MANTISKNILQWQVEQAALNKFIQDNNRAGASQVAQAKRAADSARGAKAITDAYNSSLGQMGAASRANITIVEQKMRDAQRSTERLRQLNRETADSYREIKQNAEAAASGIVSASGRALLRGEREEGRFQSFSLGTLGALPGLGGTQAFGVASDVFELVDALPNLKFALQTVKASVLENLAAIGSGSVARGAGLVGALGGAALAIKLVTDEFERARQTALGYAAQQAELNTLIAGGATTADLTAVRDKAVAEQEGFQRTAERGRELLQGYLDIAGSLPEGANALTPLPPEYMAQLDAAKQALEAFFGIDVDRMGGLAGALAAIEDMEKKAEKAGVAVATANLALESNSTLEANNAARQRARDQRNLVSAAAYLAADKLTAEQRQQHIAELQREIDSYQYLIDNGNLHADTQSELVNRIRLLNAEQSAYKNTVESTADALAEAEERSKALSDQTDAYFKALEIEGKAREDLIAARRKEEDDRAAHALKVLMILQELADKEAELWRKAGEETLEAEAKHQADRRKQELAYFKQVQEIQRRANASIANAVYARDALAAYQAMQQRGEELRQAKEANDERLKELDAALEEQKNVIAKRLQEQLATQRRAAEDAIRQEMDRRRKEAEINNRAIQAALVAYNNARIATEQIAINGSNGQRVIHTQMWQDLNSIAVTWAFNTANTVGSIFRSVFGFDSGAARPPAGGRGAGGGGGALMTPYAPRRESLPDPRTGVARKIVNFNLNLDGETIRVTSRQQAMNVLGERLEKMGVR